MHKALVIVSDFCEGGSHVFRSLKLINSAVRFRYGHEGISLRIYRNSFHARAPSEIASGVRLSVIRE